MAKSTYKQYWCLLIIFVIVIDFAVATEIPIMPVKVITAKKKDMPVTLQGIGHLEPYYAINIKSRINGRLEKVFITDGAIVKKGEQLFEIDTLPYQLQVKQAEAMLKKEEANLAETNKLSNISTKLFKKEIIAKEALDKVQASAAEAEASVAAAKANLNIAKQNLKYCKITAPVDGMLGRKLISEGNLISAYTDILITLNDITKFKVISSLPTKEFRKLKTYYKDFPLKISISNLDNNKLVLNGSLNYVANQINSKTGMFEVQGIIENKGYNFWPGEFVNTQITLTTKPNVIIIPKQALVNSGENKTVYIVNNNTVQLRKIKVGWYTEDYAVITDGIKQDEQVVIEGLFKLYPDAKVKIIKGNNK